MAPEQFLGTPASVQSDLYGLGLILHEIFTGRRVRSGRSVAELLRQHADPPSAPSLLQPDIDPAVERIILQCLAPEPSDRPGSARDILRALPGTDRLAAAVAAGETPSPGRPMKVGVALADVLTAHYAHGAILHSLYARERTGEGASIEVSLFGCTVASLVNVGQSYLVTASLTSRHHATISLCDVCPDDRRVRMPSATRPLCSGR